MQTPSTLMTALSAAGLRVARRVASAYAELLSPRGFDLRTFPTRATTSSC